MAWSYVDTASQVWTHDASASNSQQIGNATEMWNYFRAKGYTEQATAAIMGNAQHESALNPAQWQYGTSVGNTGDGGYGLFQWDPARRYWQTYCNYYGYDRTNGYYQCEWVDTQTIGGIEGNQWIGVFSPTSWDDFKYGSYSVDQLTEAFCKNWERGNWLTNNAYLNRLANARYWYNYFTGTQPEPPTPPSGDSSAWFGVFHAVAKRRNAGLVLQKGMFHIK